MGSSASAPNATSSRLAAGVLEPIGPRVSMVQAAMLADLMPRLNALGITRPSRLTALIHIGAQPGCSQSDLALHTGLSRVSAMTMTDQLVRAGFVERRHGSDARAHRLHLTSSGSVVLQAALGQSALNEDRLFGFLDEDERTLLATLLDRVVAEADRRRPGRGNAI